MRNLFSHNMESRSSRLCWSKFQTILLQLSPPLSPWQSNSVLYLWLSWGWNFQLSFDDRIFLVDISIRTGLKVIHFLSRGGEGSSVFLSQRSWSVHMPWAWGFGLPLPLVVWGLWARKVDSVLWVTTGSYQLPPACRWGLPLDYTAASLSSDAWWRPWPWGWTQVQIPLLSGACSCSELRH